MKQILKLTGILSVALFISGCASTYGINDYNSGIVAPQVFTHNQNGTNIPKETIYYNSKGQVYNPNGQNSVQPQNQTAPIIIHNYPAPVYQQVQPQPQVIYRPAPTYYQAPSQIVYQSAPTYYQPYQQQYQQSYNYPRQPNIGGAVVGGIAGGLVGSAITGGGTYRYNRGYGYHGGHRGGYYSRNNGNLGVIGVGAATGAILGSGCGRVSGGQVLGALIGGVAGSSIGKGSGRAVATAIGAGTGAILGGC